MAKKRKHKGNGRTRARWRTTGDVVRLWREGTELDRHDLAKQINRSESTIFRWERGDVEPHVRDIQAMEALKPGLVRALFGR